MRSFLEIVSMVLLMISFVGAQRQGDLCVVARTIQPGVCRPVLRCPAVLKATFNGLPYQVCASPENRLIVCCPWEPGQETSLEFRRQANTTTPREGDKCTMVNTGRAGVCSQFADCKTAKEAAYKGVSPQICAVEGTFQIVCCPQETVAEGDKCSVAETGRTGKCLRLSKCSIAVEAALKGITPQICTLDGSVPIVCCEGIFEGDNCTMVGTGWAGVCSRFANCQTAIKASSKGISPQRCDLTDNESELVCCMASCPPLPKGLVTQLPIGSRAAGYCIELAEKIHPCQETHFGWTRGDICPLLTPDSNIVYHDTPMTTTAEAPYYGRIGSGQTGEIDWKTFPVSLVSDQWVLCGARAIEVIGSSNVKFVGLGGNFTPQYNPDETYGVKKQHSHPSYNSGYTVVYNDIALLQLDRRVTFTSRILPACLHTGTPLPNSGFILTGPKFSPATFDYKTTMQTISQEECSGVFSIQKLYHPAGLKNDLQICSRPVHSTKNCPNWYSGAALTLPDSLRVIGTHLLVGLGFYRESPCTYTNNRISSYVPWIEGIVWPDSSVEV